VSPETIARGLYDTETTVNGRGDGPARSGENGRWIVATARESSAQVRDPAAAFVACDL
jgi:hypothetical protein